MNTIALNPRDTSDPREDRAVFRKTFENRPGVDFSALNEATEYLAQRGFSFGPGCAGKPSGVLYGRHWLISKWRNMSPQQQAELHGTICGDRRNGPVRLAIFWSAPAFAIAAIAEPYVADRIVTAWANQQ